MATPFSTTLITGFLGAGKTSLVNLILSQHADKKISVILNEFGDVKLESEFIDDEGVTVAEIASGCVCCVAKADVPRVIDYVVRNAPDTEYLLVEASGLSDPEPVRAVLSSSTLADQISFDANICVVDALNFMATRQENPIVNSQLGDAELVVLNKTQLAGPEQTQAVIQAITAMLPRVRILDFDQGISPAYLLSPELTLHTPTPTTDTPHDHADHVFQEFWYQHPTIFDPTQLTYFLRDVNHGVIRVKGYIMASAPIAGQPPLKILVSVVAGRVDLRPSEWAPDQAHESVLLFLGQEFDETAVITGLKKAEATTTS